MCTSLTATVIVVVVTSQHRLSSVLQLSLDPRSPKIRSSVILLYYYLPTPTYYARRLAAKILFLSLYNIPRGHGKNDGANGTLQPKNVTVFRCARKSLWGVSSATRGYYNIIYTSIVSTLVGTRAICSYSRAALRDRPTRPLIPVLASRPRGRTSLHSYRLCSRRTRAKSREKTKPAGACIMYTQRATCDRASTFYSTYYNKGARLRILQFKF